MRPKSLPAGRGQNPSSQWAGILGDEASQLVRRQVVGQVTVWLFDWVIHKPEWYGRPRQLNIGVHHNQSFLMQGLHGWCSHFCWKRYHLESLYMYIYIYIYLVTFKVLHVHVLIVLTSSFFIMKYLVGCGCRWGEEVTMRKSFSLECSSCRLRLSSS